MCEPFNLRVTATKVIVLENERQPFRAQRAWLISHVKMQMRSSRVYSKTQLADHLPATYFVALGNDNSSRLEMFVERKAVFPRSRMTKLPAAVAGP
jgi:hypothetical protein